MQHRTDPPAPATHPPVAQIRCRQVESGRRFRSELGSEGKVAKIIRFNGAACDVGLSEWADFLLEARCRPGSPQMGASSGGPGANGGTTIPGDNDA